MTWIEESLERIIFKRDLIQRAYWGKDSVTVNSEKKLEYKELLQSERNIWSPSLLISRNCELNKETIGWRFSEKDWGDIWSNSIFISKKSSGNDKQSSQILILSTTVEDEEEGGEDGRNAGGGIDGGGPDILVAVEVEVVGDNDRTIESK